MSSFSGPGDTGVFQPRPGAAQAAKVVWPADRARVRSHVDAGGIPLYLMNGRPTPVFPSRDRVRQLALKRMFDVAIALAALMVLAPLFCLVAIAIRLGSRGPVFFGQTREGHGGRAFRMFKFRTMRVEDCDASGVMQTIEGDPRVTAIGRFLRRTSIDELPQLINVLVGDMSIVGPRPHVSGMMAGGVLYTELVPHYAARLDMLPGITGWAQANGLRGTTRDPAVARARIDHDIAYIQNFSLMLDLRIVWMTFWREFIGGTGS
jgi:lipopolysaccharide/colanic/teichoic acid biosynthesis glycosyltransferase